MISNLLLTTNIGSWIMNGFRSLTFLLDHAVYWLAKIAYEVFYSVARTKLLNDQVVQNFTQRVYAILGILMIFILAWNLLNYIVDPDKINDKKMGASSIIKDVVIALIIILILPQIFNKLYSLQNQILESNVISNLIIGGYADDSEPTYQEYKKNKSRYSSYTQYLVQNGANTMVANVYSAFLYPNSGKTTLDCNKCDTGADNDTCREDELFRQYCAAYSNVKSYGNIKSFSNFYNNDAFNYLPLVSTAGGVVLLFFTLSFCLNLGIRAGKLAILQLIAPIPVVMELLPNKKGTRKNWMDMLIKVYCEVFLYQAVIYITIFLISLLPSVITQLWFNQGENTSFVQIVTIIILIFGLLMFAKEAPQMIFDLFGIKSSGTIAAAAKRALKMSSATVGGIGAAATSGFNSLGRGIGNVRNAQGFRARLGAGLGGLASTASGLLGGFGRGAYMNRNGYKNLRANTSRAISDTANAQARFGRRVHNLGTTLGNARDSIRDNGFRGAVQNWGSNTVSSIGDSIRTGFQQWTNTEDFNVANEELQSYGRFLELAGGTSVKFNEDSTYANYQSTLDQLRTRVPRNGRERQQLNAQIQNVENLMDGRKRELLLKKKDSIIENSARIREVLSNNENLRNLATTNGINMDVLSVSSNSSETDILAAQRTIADLEKAVKARSGQIKAESAQRDERSRANNSSSGNEKK